jgi:hypothetical protein
MAHLFSFFIHGHWELNFVQTIWDKTEVLLRNNLGTWWEHWEQEKKKQKNPHSPLQEKNWTPQEGILSLFIGCMNFYVWNWWHSPAAPHPERKKLDPLWGHTEPSHWVHVLLFPKLFVTIFDRT